MSQIQVDISGIRNTNYNVPHISSKVNHTKRTIGILKWKIPNDIAARYGIRQRIESIYREIEQVEKKINSLYDITNSCVFQYENAEKENKRNADMFL